MRWERECEGYIRLVYYILDLFVCRLEALGKMSVNQSRVKGHENVSTLSRSSRTRVWMSTFVCTSSHSHLTKSLYECLPRECKPGITHSTFSSILTILLRPVQTMKCVLRHSRCGSHEHDVRKFTKKCLWHKLPPRLGRTSILRQGMPLCSS